MTIEEARIILECIATNMVGEYASTEMPKEVKRVYDATDIAIEALKKQAIKQETSDKYRWHDLRKNPDDLPSGNWDEKLLCVIDSPIRFFRKYRICHYVRGDFLDFYSNLYATNKLEFQIVVAWREIEPF